MIEYIKTTYSRAGCERVTCFAKDRKRAASARVGRDGRMSRHRTAELRRISKFGVLSSHVIGSHLLGRVLHDVVTFSILGHRLHESSAL